MPSAVVSSSVVDGPVPPEGDAGAVEEGDVRLLPDGQDDGVGLDRELAARDRHRPASPVGVGLAQLVAHALQGNHPAVLEDDALGRGQLDQLVALVEQVRSSSGSAGISACVRR